MRHRTFLVPLALALPLAGLAGPPASAAPAAAPAVALDHADGVAVPDRYIVTVRPGGSPRAVARAVATSPAYVYAATINGFAATLDPVQLGAVLAHPDVVAVEQDQVVTATTTQGTVFSGWDLWGLDRVDQRNLPLSNTYTYNSTGAGVHVYVFDSGIRTSHLDFGGRANNVYDAFGGNGQDCDGHGSHVAGTIGGNLLGVAKAPLLHGVRVLDCSGNGTVAGIIAAIEWVRTNFVAPAVANMSLSSGFSSAFNTAVNELVNAGVFTAVAAGNAGQNACNFSPSSVTAALVVAASDRNDRRASFSNHGSCVDLYAPGVAIWSAWYTGDDVIARLDGTSQASPHAAGLAALYKATFGDASAATVHSYLVNNATVGVVTHNRTGTPNRLLYTNNL